MKAYRIFIIIALCVVLAVPLSATAEKFLVLLFCHCAREPNGPTWPTCQRQGEGKWCALPSEPLRKFLWRRFDLEALPGDGRRESLDVD